MNGIGWHCLEPTGFPGHRPFSAKSRNSQANQGELITSGINELMHFSKETKIEI